MHPIFFKIGELEISGYGFFLAVGILGAVLAFRLLCGKLKIDDDTYNFYSFTGILSIAVGFFFAVLYQAFYDFLESGRFDLASSGMTFMGGLIGGVLSFLLITLIFAKPKVKADFWKVANIATISILVAHGFGRLGCLMAGCCYGKETTSFLGIEMVANGAAGKTVYPTQLFEALFLFVLAIVLTVLLLKKRGWGIQLLVYLYAYAVWRFGIEFLRSDYRGATFLSLYPSQIQSIVMILIAGGLTFYIYFFKRVPFLKLSQRFIAADLKKTDDNVAISTKNAEKAQQEAEDARAAYEEKRAAFGEFQKAEDGTVIIPEELQPLLFDAESLEKHASNLAFRRDKAIKESASSKKGAEYINAVIKRVSEKGLSEYFLFELPKKTKTEAKETD